MNQQLQNLNNNSSTYNEYDNNNHNNHHHNNNNNYNHNNNQYSELQNGNGRNLTQYTPINSIEHNISGINHRSQLPTISENSSSEYNSVINEYMQNQNHIFRPNSSTRRYNDDFLQQTQQQSQLQQTQQQQQQQQQQLQPQYTQSIPQPTAFNLSNWIQEIDAPYQQQALEIGQKEVLSKSTTVESSSQSPSHLQLNTEGYQETQLLQKPLLGLGNTPKTGTRKAYVPGTRPIPRPTTGTGTRNGVRPRPNTGTGVRPITRTNSQTGTNSPMSLRLINGTGSRPRTGTGSRPITGTGSRPITGTGSRPLTGTGSRLPTRTGSRPLTGTGTRPLTGTGSRFRNISTPSTPSTLNSRLRLISNSTANSPSSLGRHSRTHQAISPQPHCFTHSKLDSTTKTLLQRPIGAMNLGKLLEILGPNITRGIEESIEESVAESTSEAVIMQSQESLKSTILPLIEEKQIKMERDITTSCEIAFSKTSEKMKEYIDMTLEHNIYKRIDENVENKMEKMIEKTVEKMVENKISQQISNLQKKLYVQYDEMLHDTKVDIFDTVSIMIQNSYKDLLSNIESLWKNDASSGNSDNNNKNQDALRVRESAGNTYDPSEEKDMKSIISQARSTVKGDIMKGDNMYQNQNQKNFSTDKKLNKNHKDQNTSFLDFDVSKQLDTSTCSARKRSRNYDFNTQRTIDTVTNYTNTNVNTNANIKTNTDTDRHIHTNSHANTYHISSTFKSPDIDITPLPVASPPSARTHTRTQQTLTQTSTMNREFLNGQNPTSEPPTSRKNNNFSKRMRTSLLSSSMFNTSANMSSYNDLQVSYNELVDLEKILSQPIRDYNKKLESMKQSSGNQSEQHIKHERTDHIDRIENIEDIEDIHQQPDFSVSKMPQIKEVADESAKPLSTLSHISTPLSATTSQSLASLTTLTTSITSSITSSTSPILSSVALSKQISPPHDNFYVPIQNTIQNNNQNQNSTLDLFPHENENDNNDIDNENNGNGDGNGHRHRHHHDNMNINDSDSTKDGADNDDEHSNDLDKDNNSNKDDNTPHTLAPSLHTEDRNLFGFDDLMNVSNISR